MPKRVVIIGGGAAGVSAAVAARKKDFNAQITVVSEESELAYSRCGMPFCLGGEIKNAEKLVLHDESFYSMMRIKYLVSTTATGVDTASRKVKAKKGEQEKTLEYDSLVIATGAKAFTPRISGLDSAEVHYMRSLQDLRKLKKAAKKGKHAVVVGARYTGLEAAEALAARGVKVTVVDILPRILAGLFDKELAEGVQARMQKDGIQFVLGHEVEEVKNSHCFVGGKNLKADFIVMAAGVRGNVSLAKEAGIELGETGLIKVNALMQTSNPDVFSAGDCVELTHLLTREPAPMQLGSLAARGGEIAGANAAGDEKTMSRPLGAHVSRLFGLEVAGTGLTEEAALSYGFRTVVQTVDAASRPHYFGSERVKVKLVSNESGRLLGAQVIGTGEAGWRINYLTQAIANGIGVGEVARAEFSYCPPTADSLEPLQLAASALHRKILLTTRD